MVVRWQSNLGLRLAMVSAAVSPVVLALLLTLAIPYSQPAAFTTLDSFSPVTLRPVVSSTAEALEKVFRQHDYRWPPTQSVPALAVQSLPSGLEHLPIDEKKALFFRLLLPLVVAENQRLKGLRHWLMQVQAGGVIADSGMLATLAVEYRLDPVLPPTELLPRLLKRIDTVPAALVLAQAANESGWGTSRFSRVANNLFGEWTWDASQGERPLRRMEGATHYVRRFDNLRQSVRSYMQNLNRGAAYSRLRAMRASMRAHGEVIDPFKLASGLSRYSERGEAYVGEIQALIRSNGLNSLGQLDLHH